MENKITKLSVEELKSRVYFALINAENHKELLRHAVRKEYLDLSIILYISMDERTKTIVTKEHLEAFGISVDELYNMALRNMPHRFPHEFQSLGKKLNEMTGCTVFLEDTGSPLYLLSHSTGDYGAAAMLYPGVLKRCAEEIGGDLIVLPSSVHEVLLYPVQSFEEDLATEEGAWKVAENMRTMVQSINVMEVAPEERLSNNAYYYSLLADRLMIFV